jgi:hypothetical protein
LLFESFPELQNFFFTRCKETGWNRTTITRL